MSAEIQRLTDALKVDLSYVRQSIEWNQQFNAEMERKREATFGDFARWLLLLGNTAFSFYVTYRDGKQLLTALETRRKLTVRPQVKAAKPSFSFGALTEPAKPKPKAKRRSRGRQ